MKATELMIGDWVFTRGENIQVTLLYDGFISTEHHRDSHDYYFKPIPLTPEILEKNGFKIGHHGTYHLGGFHIGNHFDDLFAPYIDIGYVPRNLSYVHELQHALRFCGLNDLADNFQI